MAERIKFHLDESVDPDIAKALRQHDIYEVLSPEDMLDKVEYL